MPAELSSGRLRPGREAHGRVLPECVERGFDAYLTCARAGVIRDAARDVAPVAATIPGAGQAASGRTYFAQLLRHVHRTWPAARDFRVEPESYRTGMTAKPTRGYQAGFPRLFQVADDRPRDMLWPTRAGKAV